MKILKEISRVLGLTLKEKEESLEADEYIDLLLEIREELRSKKEYGLADKIRDELRDMGVEVEDSEEGPRWYVS